MQYANIRDQIKSGDLLAFTHTRARSFYDLQVWAVRISTASQFCHVAQVWTAGGRLWVLEAVTPSVRMVPLSHFVAEGFYWIPMGAPMSDAELEAALEQVAAVGYSKWQAVLAFFGRLKLGADRLTQCCEYVITNRRLSGIDLGPIATPAAVVQSAQDMGRPVFFIKW